jgi:hypothetical protein
MTMQNLKRIDVDSADLAGSESEAQVNLAPALGLVDNSHSEVASPARVLQQRLIDHLSAEGVDLDDDGRRWAPRTTLLFCGGVSLALWGAIAVGIAAFH